MKIIRIFYDWYYTNDGDSYAVYDVERDDVVKIIKEECDREIYFRVFFKNGNCTDIYNVNQVDWEKEAK